MTDNTPEFWANENSMDPVSRGWSELRESAAREPSPPEASWEDDEHHQSTRAASDEVQNRGADRSDWDNSREHREWLGERYPGVKVADYGRTMLGWHQSFQRDPAGTKEAWIRHWASQPPFHHRPSAKPKQAEPPSDLTESGKAEWQLEQDARNAFQSSSRDRADADEFAATSELRQLVKQNTGLSLSQFLEKCRAIDAASLDDPAGIAHRFAVFNGFPATEGQARDIQAAAHYQERVQVAGNWLTQLEQQNILPPDYKALESKTAEILQHMRREGHPIDNPENWGRALDYAIKLARVETQQEQKHSRTQGLIRAETAIEQFRSDPAHKYYDNLEEEIANLLQNGGVKRTGNMLADLKAAYDKAYRINPEIHAEKAAKASRSVSGAPSPGARAIPRRQSGGDSIDDDAREAFYQASSRA